MCWHNVKKNKKNCQILLHIALLTTLELLIRNRSRVVIKDFSTSLKHSESMKNISSKYSRTILVITVYWSLKLIYTEAGKEKEKNKLCWLNFHG